MMGIHKIIMRTLKVVPNAWDMNHQKFNCDCHMELTFCVYKKWRIRTPKLSANA
jgi:hypothetical protein